MFHVPLGNNSLDPRVLYVERFSVRTRHSECRMAALEVTALGGTASQWGVASCGLWAKSDHRPAWYGPWANNGFYVLKQMNKDRMGCSRDCRLCVAVLQLLGRELINVEFFFLSFNSRKRG